MDGVGVFKCCKYMYMYGSHFDAPDAHFIDAQAEQFGNPK
jgi:hypothetical protein